MHLTRSAGPAEPETAKQKFERERLTRRQALKRFGITSAMTAFALFSVDDLARMVGVAMERQAKNSKIAEQVAKEFQRMGLAMADPGDYGPTGAYYTQCSGDWCWRNTSTAYGESHLTNCQAKCGTAVCHGAVASDDCATECAKIAKADG